jgi:transposase
LVARRGKKKGAVAVGHRILVIAYHILKYQTTYQELAADYFDQRDHETLRRRLIHRLAGLGYSVALTPLAEAA